MAPRQIVHVQLESPLPQLDRLFDYAVPAALDEAAQPGVRVKVPLRSAGRVVAGFIVARGLEADGERPLSEIDAVVSSAAVLPDRLYRLSRAVADRAAGSVSDVLRLAIPRRMVRAEKSWLARSSTERDDATAGQPLAELSQRRAASATLAQYETLAARLNARDRIALDAIPQLDDALPAWARVLAAAASHVFDSGASAVIAVPDHRDLELLLAALTDVVPAEAVVRHDAAQPAQQRYAGYLRTLDDEPCIVVGNRSVVYAPVPNLGLLALWDDGDPLYEEPLAPWVHARDVMLIRQGLQPCALVYAGHTRSAEVQRLVELEFVHEVRQAWPSMPKVVLASARDDEQSAARIPPQAYRIAQDTSREGPVLVQVARPGFAPSLVCSTCRAPVHCAHCGGPMGAKRHGASPTCAWCGRVERTWRCASCEGVTLRWAASGSERTAAELGRAFPGRRMIVSDGAHPVTEVDDSPSIVVATRGAEPLTRRGYRAILLLDGERMLQAPYLRVGEACLRWWSNAAALAARGAQVHLVGVSGPVAKALATWTQSSYARAELEQRASVHLPPTSRVALVDGEAEAVSQALSDLRRDVSSVAGDAVLGPVDVPGAPGDRQRTRAIVRFDYAHGGAVAQSLRASVVARAIDARRRPRQKHTVPRQMSSRPALIVRFDPSNPELVTHD